MTEVKQQLDSQENAQTPERVASTPERQEVEVRGYNALQTKEVIGNIATNTRGATTRVEEMDEIIGKILIPDEWRVVEPPLYHGAKEKQPVTTEYLQKLGKRLADEQPMSKDEWSEILGTLYFTVTPSKQPEAQKLWELFLEKGIQGLSHLIAITTVEEIQRQANTDEYYKKKYKDPATRARMWWANGTARFWHNGLTHMLNTDAGTREEAILRLGPKMLEKVSIPFTKRGLELDPSRKPRIMDSEIETVIRCMKIAQVHLRFDQRDREEWEAEITKTTEEIVKSINV